MHRDHSTWAFPLHLILSTARCMLKLMGKVGILGGLRRLWPVVSRTDLEARRSDTDLCHSVAVVWFWVGRRIKQKKLNWSPCHPPLLISVCCIFQSELANEFQAQLHLNCSKAKASRWGCGGWIPLRLCTGGLSHQLCQTVSHPRAAGIFLRAKRCRCTFCWRWISSCCWIFLPSFSPCLLCPCSLGKDSG